MTLSQQIDHLQENSYDDMITATDLPNGYFLAVTSINLPDGSDTREIRVDLFPMEQINESTQTIGSGLIVKQSNEKAIKATLYQDGKELATNTTNYA